MIEIETLNPIGIEQDRLVTQLGRLLVLDLGMTEYLSQINHAEMVYRPEFVEAVNFTSFLIRKSVFAAFTDILDHGSTTMIREAVDVLELCRKYREYEIETIQVEGSAQDAFNRIDHFVKDFQALGYQNTYI